MSEFDTRVTGYSHAPIRGQCPFLINLQPFRIRSIVGDYCPREPKAAAAVTLGYGRLWEPLGLRGVRDVQMYTVEKLCGLTLISYRMNSVLFK